MSQGWSGTTMVVMYGCECVWGGMIVDGDTIRGQRNAQKVVTGRASHTRTPKRRKNKVVVMKGEDGHGSEGRISG